MGTNQIKLETNILITVCVFFQKFLSKTLTAYVAAKHTVRSETLLSLLVLLGWVELPALPPQPYLAGVGTLVSVFFLCVFSHPRILVLDHLKGLMHHSKQLGLKLDLIYCLWWRWEETSKLHQFICMSAHVLIIHMAQNKLTKLYMIHFLYISFISKSFIHINRI